MTTLSTRMLGTAVLLGLATDLLLRIVPWGVNLPLWTLLLFAAGAFLAYRDRLSLGPETPWLALTALVLALAFARRAAESLQALTVLAWLVVLASAAMSARGLTLRNLDAFNWVRGTIAAAFESAVGLLPLATSDVHWRDSDKGPSSLRHVPAIAGGVILAIPLLLVFGALFAQADTVFANIAQQVLRIDVLLPHVVWTVFGTAVTAGWLRHALLRRGAVASGASPGVALYVPVATALVLLNALFLLFVVVQLRYLFGGATLVEVTTGLTYAEYARAGFFELVVASGLVLPVLSGAEWAVRVENRERQRAFRLLAGLLLALLAVIVASALERMRLYVAAYGLSEERLYATAVEVLLVGLFGWFAATTLRGMPQRFPFGGLVWSLTVLGGLHIVNPDAFVARWNLGRPAAERPFDAQYAATLSADAAPVLFASLPQLEPTARCTVAKGLARWSAPDSTADWRGWNAARARARRLAGEHGSQLAVACPTQEASHEPH